MTSFTPSASISRTAIAHEFTIDGAYTNPDATVTTFEVAPETTEKRTHSFVHNHQNVTIDRIVSEFVEDTKTTDRLVFSIEGLHRTVLITRADKGLFIDINHLRFRAPRQQPSDHRNHHPGWQRHDLHCRQCAATFSCA